MPKRLAEDLHNDHPNLTSEIGEERNDALKESFNLEEVTADDIILNEDQKRIFEDLVHDHLSNPNYIGDNLPEDLRKAGQYDEVKDQVSKQEGMSWLIANTLIAGQNNDGTYDLDIENLKTIDPSKIDTEEIDALAQKIHAQNFSDEAPEGNILPTPNPNRCGRGCR